MNRPGMILPVRIRAWLDEPTNGSASPGRNEKLYNRIKIRLSIADILLDLLLVAFFAFSGASREIVAQIAARIDASYLQYILFMAVMGAAFSVIGFPLDYYGSYVLEHRFGLSNQGMLRWIAEKMKAAAVGTAIGLPLSLAFFFFLRASGGLWWLYFSALVIAVSVILARVAPVIIFPIFYKFKKLEQLDIEERLRNLLADQKIAFEGIYSFDMSRDTKKANAGFAGIGRSRRIILSDTLIREFSPDEIAVVFAHEMGHYKKVHILKNLILSSGVILASFFLCGRLYEWSLIRQNFAHVHDIAAIPILIFYLSLFGLLIMPLTNAISRHYEREADRYALAVTGDAASFISSMERLAAMNLSDMNPHPLVEFFFYGHPSIKKRIDSARGIIPSRYTAP